jgi:hypothetical protein
LICSECGSYQPDRAKYCGICGSALSQEGLVESFLKSDSEHDIVLPRHRSPLFYVILVAIVILALLLFAGAGYLVYRVAWGERGDEASDGEIQDTTNDYTDAELGFSLSYPNNWTLEVGIPPEDELAALTVSLTAQKNLELGVYQLDPVISIGGIEGIEEYLVEDAAGRASAQGGQLGSMQASQPADAGSGYGQEETYPTVTDDEQPEVVFERTTVSGFPAFYTEFTANVMGEETKFLLYYIVADDYIFLFQARAPASEYKDVRPQFFSIAGSLKWQDIMEEPAPTEQPGISNLSPPAIWISTLSPPVILFNL